MDYRIEQGALEVISDTIGPGCSILYFLLENSSNNQFCPPLPRSQLHSCIYRGLRQILIASFLVCFKFLCHSTWSIWMQSQAHRNPMSLNFITSCVQKLLRKSLRTSIYRAMKWKDCQLLARIYMYIYIGLSPYLSVIKFHSNFYHKILSVWVFHFEESRMAPMRSLALPSWDTTVRGFNVRVCGGEKPPPRDNGNPRKSLLGESCRAQRLYRREAKTPLMK